MEKARLDGIYFLALGTLLFVLLGAVLERGFSVPLVDFRVLYYPARCLLHHGDPYNERAVLETCRSEGESSPEKEGAQEVLTAYLYLPTAFAFTVPFALLPWGPAHWLWLAGTIISFVFAVSLIWSVGAHRAPVLSGFLAGFLVANSELLVITGNAAGIAISFCAIAAWCFIRQRFAFAGILCMAISMILKPHDTVLVWLYFALAGGMYRRRATQAMVAAASLGIPAIVWVYYESPHWLAELHSHLTAFAVHGGINDPGLASSGTHGIGMLISLQAVISTFWDDPRIYNNATYLLIAPLLFIWAYVCLRSRPSPPQAWLAIASISALSMLPVYHRQADARLLLLTVPACAMLWAEGGIAGRIALTLNVAAFVLVGDLPWAIFFGLTNGLRLPATSLPGQALVLVQVLPVPLILLAIGLFYLWVYVQRGRKLESTCINSV